MDPLERTQRLAKALRRLGLVALLFGAINGGVVGVAGAVIVLGFLLHVAALSAGATRSWFNASAVALATNATAEWVYWKHGGSTAGAVVIASGGAVMLLAVLGCRQLATWFGGLGRWTAAGVLAGVAAFGFAIVAGYFSARPIGTDGSMRYFGVPVPVNALTIVVSAIAVATFITTWRAFVDLEARVSAAVDRAMLDRVNTSPG